MRGGCLARITALSTGLFLSHYDYSSPEVLKPFPEPIWLWLLECRLGSIFHSCNFRILLSWCLGTRVSAHPSGQTFACGCICTWSWSRDARDPGLGVTELYTDGARGQFRIPNSRPHGFVRVSPHLVWLTYRLPVFCEALPQEDACWPQQVVHDGAVLGQHHERTLVFASRRPLFTRLDSFIARLLVMADLPSQPAASKQHNRGCYLPISFLWSFTEPPRRDIIAKLLSSGAHGVPPTSLLGFVQKQ